MDKNLGPHPTRSEKAALLRRLCESELFPGLQQEVLKFLFEHWDHSPNAALSESQIAAAIYGKSHLGGNARVVVARVRRKLERFFQLFPREPFSVSIVDKTFRLRFTFIAPTFKWEGSALKAFWHPFLSPQRTVLIMAGDVPDFCDFVPKIQLQRPLTSPTIPVRGSVSVVSGQSKTFLPTGMLRAITTFSNFLGKNNIDVRYDISTEAPTPTGSIIVIGKDPFGDELQVWPTKGLFAHYPEDYPPEHVMGEALQDGISKTKPPRFVCYVTVERRPVRNYKGIFKLSIRTGHSIGVEAAAQFLTSEKHLAEALQQFSAEKNSFPDFSGLLLKVTCSVSNPSKMRLRPGIPRIYLEILRTELLQVVDEPMRLFTSPGESVESEMEVIDRLATLEKSGRLDAYDHTLDLMDKYDDYDAED
jgi:hypothetical protein